MVKKSTRREGLHRDEAGTRDREGFIAPSIGLMEHALYFTTAPSVPEKTKQLISQSRLDLPGVVNVWDETIGRRTGSKAVPNSWWATHGSLTTAFVFQASPKVRKSLTFRRVANAVIATADSFSPREAIVAKSKNNLTINGQKLAVIEFHSHQDCEFVVIRINCCTDFSKAQPEIRDNAVNLVDYIDVKQLPLRRRSTLPNTFLTRLMSEIPRAMFR